MKRVNCSQESAVAAAVRAGDLDGALTSHVARCEECREIVQTAGWMQSLARDVQSDKAFPSASLLWWKTQLSEKQLKTEKAQNLFEWMEILSVTVITLGVMGWAVWKWFTIQAAFERIVGPAEPWLNGYSIPGLFLPLAAILCLVALAYPIFVDD